MPQLNEALNRLHAKQPFTVALDLTRGKLSDHLELPSEIARISEFSISRIRQADKPGLPTTGHLISHCAEELGELLGKFDVSHLLMLDDTSFSGTTSAVVESVVRKSLQQKRIDFTHGFMILNEGRLGENPGAKQLLNSMGSLAVGGTTMHTPGDDGWHFFDMVEQENFDAHIEAIMSLLHEPQKGLTAEDFQLIFPTTLSSHELVSAQRSGHFLTKQEITGDQHVRNPQPLVNIVNEGHLMKPEAWRIDEAATVELLKTMNSILTGGRDA